MSERPVAPLELRELARAFEKMASVIRQGSPTGDRFVEGAAYAFDAAAGSARLLSVVGEADQVTIELPPETAYRLKVSADVRPLEEEGTEDPIERARRLS